MELYNISNLSYFYPGSDMNALSDISLKNKQRRIHNTLR